MKKKAFNPLTVFLLIITFLLNTACSKEDGHDQPAEKPEMTARINGMEWQADMPNCIIRDSIATIRTNCADKTNIGITFYNFSEGNHLLSSSGNDFAVITQENCTYSTFGDNQGGGKLHIISIRPADSKISGTFEFVARDALSGKMVEVTHGKFANVPYTYVTSPGIFNKLQVEINGEDFVDEEVKSIVYMNKFYIVAEDNAGLRKVSLGFPADIAAGNYAIHHNGISGKYRNEEGIEMLADSGMFEVVKHDMEKEIITGYFCFEVSDTISGSKASLKNGSYYIVY